MGLRRVLLLLAVSVAVLAACPFLAAGDLRPRTPPRENPYFPLQVGNQWVYVFPDRVVAQLPPGSGIVQPMAVVSVTGQVPGSDGYTYFALERYFGDRRLVRAGFGGAVVEADAGGGPPHLWYLLQAPVGTRWTMSQGDPADPCQDGAEVRVASRTDTVKVPAGEFRNVVRLEYIPVCADAGITAEWFAPGVGLIQRRSEGLDGPTTMELARAFVRDRLFPGRAYSTTLLLDRPFYGNNLFPVVGPGPAPRGIAVVDATFLIANGSEIPVTFEFDGCRSATFRVLDAAGNEMLKVRGDDGGCCGCPDAVSVTLARNTLVLRAGIRLALPGGSPIPDGEYVVVADLDSVNLPPPLRPSARAPIRVTSTW